MILQRKSMVTGHYEIVVPSQVCEECVVGKQRRFEFRNSKSWRSKEVLGQYTRMFMGH